MSNFRFYNSCFLFKRNVQNPIQACTPIGIDKSRNSVQFLKSKLLKFGDVLYTTFSEFCECSSINGVRYITERRLHWSERMWWIIAVGVSLWMSVTLIHDAWVNWRDNPTTMKVEIESIISEIPFPTVTICPSVKATKEKFDLASKFINARTLHPNLSEIDKFRLDTLANICTQTSSEIIQNIFFNDVSPIYDIIEDLAPPLDYVMNECRWKTKPFNCSKHFAPIVTDRGLCFTFNALNPDDFYTKEMTPRLKTIRREYASLENEYPLQVDESGPDAGLEITLIVHEHDRTSLCTSNDEEFEVFLSVPGESMINAFPHEFEIKVPISTNSLIPMEPELTVTSEGLDSYDPNERGCFHSSERKLTYHKIYSENNCYLECATNFTIQRYGCPLFYLPQHKDANLCGSTAVTDYRLIRLTWFLSKNSVPEWIECNCLPSCESLKYNPKLDSVKFNLSALNEAKGSHTKYLGTKMSKVAIFFKERELKRFKRTETNTYADFLAFCGGLLGLFLGITALSIIEIVYYLSLRLFWNFRNLCARNSVTSTDVDIAGPSSVEIQNDTCQEEVNLSHVAKKVAIEFCDNGCFHGVQYITGKGLYWVERFGWFIAIFISFGVCGYVIRNIWVEWSENPVTMTNGKNDIIWNVPYPAITLCPDTKTLKTKFDIPLALKNLNNLSDIEKYQLKALAHVCPVLADQLQYTDEDEDEYMGESIFNIIQNLAINLNESIFHCNVLRESGCSRLFVPVLTDEGLCFTINNLNSHEIYNDAMAPGMMIVKENPNISSWNLDSMYTHTAAIQYPFSNYEQYYKYIYFKINKNDNSQCKEIDEGIKVIFSVPGDPLILSRDYYRVPLSKLTQIGIVAKLTTTSEALRRYSPSQRQCFYSYERQLRFFKNYTQNNCKDECLANFTKMECGCVKFSMPRDRETRICGRSNIMCYRSAEKKLRVSDRAEYFRSECNCLPGCTSIDYTATIDQRNDADNMAYRFLDESIINRTVTGLGFKLDVYVQVVNRRDTYTWIEFFSLVGGFLGVFLGMSVLSVVEIIYYPTLRLFWAFRRWKSEANANQARVEIIGEEAIIQIVQPISEEIVIDDLSLDSM